MTQLKYLGHAGFVLETEESIVVIDPWLSRHGAFDSGWFQFPRNHDLEAPLIDALKATRKRVIVYLTHHHKDHFDLDFLKKLPGTNTLLVLPRYGRDPFAPYLGILSHLAVKYLVDEEAYAFPGGYLQVYLDDSGLNRDSAVFVNASGLNFFDMNDAKLHERLHRLKADKGPIDVYACQFSGATWHPICYQYPAATRDAIIRSKVHGKFEAVARSLEVLKPRLFLPSAGPACFLDPELFPLNFAEPTVFPEAPAVMRFLRYRLPEPAPQLEDLQPGDTISWNDAVNADRARPRLVLAKQPADGLDQPQRRRAYLEAYQAAFADDFRALKKPLSADESASVWSRLTAELRAKLRRFDLRTEVPVPLYFGLRETPERWLRVDFTKPGVSEVPAIVDAHFYSLQAPVWQVARVLNRQITWEDFYLTFRASLHRVPDVYNTLLNGFIWLQAEDLGTFCAKIRQVRAKAERIQVAALGCQYSIDRYCPHQGADLAEGYLTEDGHLVCPRHRWRFDLADGGRCRENHVTVNARAVLPASAGIITAPGRPLPPRELRQNS